MFRRENMSAGEDMGTGASSPEEQAPSPCEPVAWQPAPGMCTPRKALMLTG